MRFFGSHSLFNIVVSAVKADQTVRSGFKEQNVCLHHEVLIHVAGFRYVLHHSASFSKINI